MGIVFFRNLDPIFYIYIILGPSQKSENIGLESYSKHMLLLLSLLKLSLVMRKPAFSICENKDADQLRGTAKLICAFVFATRIVQSLYFLNTKFQASSHLLWLYSLVCVGPGRKPRRLVFSQRGSYQSVNRLLDWNKKLQLCLTRLYFSKYICLAQPLSSECFHCS